jgi:hypothetical protein
MKSVVVDASQSPVRRKAEGIKKRAARKYLSRRIRSSLWDENGLFFDRHFAGPSLCRQSDFSAEIERLHDVRVGMG